MLKDKILVYGFVIASFSAVSQTRKYSNEFLSIGVGAKSLAMSNSVVASVNDATAGYWNPAGLMGITSNIQVGLMHAEYFAGIAKYDFAAIAAPIDKTSTVALTFIRFAVDDIPDTTELIDAAGNINYDRIKSFSAADYAVILSYARQHKFIEGFRYGANAKIIRRVVGEFAQAWGFGLDLGAQYDVKHFTFGVLFRDASSTYNAWTFNNDKLRDVYKATGNLLPENSLEITLPKLLTGISYKREVWQKITMRGELDMDATFDGKRNVVFKSNLTSIDPHFGIELGYRNFIFLRGGVGNIENIKNLNGIGTYKTFQPNMGVGLKLKRLEIDYALTNIGSVQEVPYSNIISLKLDINKNLPVTPATQQ